MHNFKSSVLYPNIYKGIQYNTVMTEQKSATEKKDFSFKVPFEIEISSERISTLLCSAFEGGSIYWANDDYLVEIDIYDKFIGVEIPKMYDYEFPLYDYGFIAFRQYDENGVNIETDYLDKRALIKGAKIMAQKYPRHFNDVINYDDDAITGDVYLQCCLFGEIVYG